MSAYYINPPKPTYLTYLSPKMASRFYVKLAEWADQEYSTALRSAISRGRYNITRCLSDEWSGMRVLSNLEGFRMMCAKIDEETWNLLDRKTRKFITKAFEMYELLRDLT